MGPEEALAVFINEGIAPGLVESNCVFIGGAGDDEDEESGQLSYR